MPDFRKQILEQMELKSISRGDLAQLTGLTYMTIWKYLNDGRDCKDTTLSLMLDALGISLAVE